MDEQTFRRLAADAVAGRLDGPTYERWKAAAGHDVDRASFVVRVAEADARLSARYGPARGAAEPTQRVPKRKFLSLAVVFAVAGLVAGGLVMHSYLRAQDARGADAGNQTALDLPANNAPAGNDQPPANHPVTTPPANTEPEPLPEPEREPEPESQPKPRPVTGLRLVSAADTVSVRDESDREWRRLAADEIVPPGAAVSSKGAVRLRSEAFEINAESAIQLELAGDLLRFVEGRVSVRVFAASKYKCYRQEWSLTRGSFIVAPARLGGELFMLDGNAGDFVAPSRVALDGTAASAPLTPIELRGLELELLGPHRVLLAWDCESEPCSPPLGEIVHPGALGSASAARRKPGQPGIGVSPSTEVFKAETGARLRMRVKTTAARLRVELRVRLDDGYRVVDSQFGALGTDWHTLDVSLESLRAGRQRIEPGWLAGRVYSALLIAPCADPDNPLQRHELTIDDVLVYVPE